MPAYVKKLANHKDDLVGHQLIPSQLYYVTRCFDAQHLDQIIVRFGDDIFLLEDPDSSSLTTINSSTTRYQIIPNDSTIEINRKVS